MFDLLPAFASSLDQIERLSEHASLCRYLIPTSWAAMQANALVVIDQFGTGAHRLGWTALRSSRRQPEPSPARKDGHLCLVAITLPSLAKEIPPAPPGVPDTIEVYRDAAGNIELDHAWVSL
ncbi:hypothetical protein [Methylobacterium fujisawaense]|uniref:hypothetical protein n=1 Tax=Methylobacterium fujisawaense TaxID=107400 RepID=UPI00313CD084